MKKTLILVCAAIVAVAMLGCTNDGNVASPTPGISASPRLSPSLSPMTSPSAMVSPSANVSPTAGMSPDSSPSGSAGMGEGGNIEGFAEGDEVDVTKLPEVVVSAIKEKYAEATITGATYATYMESQMYLVTLSGAGSGVEKVYVQPDGTITPYNTESTANP